MRRRPTTLGRVRAADGAAARGARVRIVGPSGTVVADCASDGSYDGGSRFLAGRYTVRVEGHPIADSSPVRSCDLDANASIEVSFGPGGGLSRWTGRVLAPDGSSIAALDGLSANALQLVPGGGRGKALDVRISDGAINQWFEPGVYALQQAARIDGTRSARPPSRLEHAPPDPQEIGSSAINLSSDLVRDVRLEGFILSGRLAPDPNAPRPPGPQIVELRSARSPEPLRATVRPDGTYRFLGLAPGDYLLTPLHAPQTIVSIDPLGPLEVELD